MEIKKTGGRSPFIFGTVEPRDSKESVLFYGHIDKQPPLTEKWSPGLFPFQPVFKDNRLYGRGSVDDGYAFFFSIILIKAI